MKIKRLFEIPNKSKIYLVDGIEASDGSSFLIYDHPDGMYSYCVTEKSNVVHLALSTPVTKYKDGYKIINE